MTCKAHQNISVLEQGARLIHRLDDRTYQRDVKIMEVSSIGAHVRHNLDHYSRFFAGLASGTIDYDRRRRCKDLEIDRHAALAGIRAICQRLETLTEEERSLSLLIYSNTGTQTSQVSSSTTRELEFLLSHTIHHFAIVAMLCRFQNVSVEPDFGVAPSTLRYLESAPSG